MEEKQISQTQLCALLWAGLMAPAAELLPAVTLPIAGRGAWLSALAALPVLLLLGWGLGRLGLRHGGLAGAIRWGLGPVLGRLVLLLYFIWGELLLALRLRLCAQRLIASGERDGSLWFFLPAAALLVLWMGFGMAPKVTLVALTTFFPIAVSLLEGYASTDKAAANLLRAMGASRWQIFRHLEFPTALGFFFSGLRVSVSYAVVGAVISEWLGGFGGLGVYMTRVKKAYAFDKMFAVIFLISAISLLLMCLVDFLQRKCMPYRYLEQTQTQTTHRCR